MKHWLTMLVMLLWQISSYADKGPPMTSLARNHYVIDFPANWKEHDGDKGVVVFTPVTPDSRSSIMVNIQTIFTKAGQGKYKSVKDLMDDFLIQVPMHVKNARLFDRQRFELKQPNAGQLTGEQIYVTFNEGKQTFKQWQIMLVSRDGIFFQAFAYRAPLSLFDQYLPVAIRMLDSWVIN